MTKPTMTSQWDPRNFKPLDMSKIPGYPRQMPPKYEKWLPRFTGSDGERANNHMDNFWAFFQLHPISDDAEDLAMKLFSATLHGNARKWYDNLPDASITSMDQLEEIFLKKWGTKLEDIQMLLKRLDYIKQTRMRLSGNSIKGLKTCYIRSLEAIVLETSTSFISIPMHS
jgi:hypothetical protein